MSERPSPYWAAAPLLALAVLTSGVASARPAVSRDVIHVDPETTHSLTFSKLLVRIDEGVDIFTASDGYRVGLLGELRRAGYEALGAENLVFDQDRSAQARFVLGGTVRAYRCRTVQHALNCSVAVRWELLDRERDEVVYDMLSRHAEYGIPRDRQREAAQALLKGSLRSLLSRKAFVDVLLKDEEEDDVGAPSYPLRGFRACSPTESALPQAAEAVLAATALVKSGNAIGSAVLISPDGLALTAAHVLVDERNTTLQLRDGSTHEATVLRRDPRRDVALLALNTRTTPCLPLGEEVTAVGQDVYAIGSPTNERLSFSLTRGIVSGMRRWNGLDFLQTDASVNPGNSGGPLVDSSGAIVGIVASKLTGLTVEGIAFGVPIASALGVLAIEPVAATDPGLLREQRPHGSSSDTADAYHDLPDRGIPLDPDGDLRRAVDAARPWWILPARYVGYPAAIFGGALAVISLNAAGQEGRSAENRQAAADASMLFGGLFALATAGVVCSYVFEPIASEPRAPVGASVAKLETSVSLGTVQLRLTY